VCCIVLFKHTPDPDTTTTTTTTSLETTSCCLVSRAAFHLVQLLITVTMLTAWCPSSHLTAGAASLPMLLSWSNAAAVKTMMCSELSRRAVESTLSAQHACGLYTAVRSRHGSPRRPNSCRTTTSALPSGERSRHRAGCFLGAAAAAFAVTKARSPATSSVLMMSAPRSNIICMSVRS
jgi:hypothetical protein